MKSDQQGKRNWCAQLTMHGLVTFSLVTFILPLALTVHAETADVYPRKPVTVVVGFGVGGSADRMARTMSSFLGEELGQPVKVINKKGAGTLLAAKYVLSRPHDGNTVFASSFSPYLTTTILEGNASYTVDDFAYINFQWFDEDLIAVNKDSRFNSLLEILEAIRMRPKTVRASVVRGSAGHLMIKLILKKYNIPQENLNLVTYNSGGQARAAVAGGVVDFIVISAKGTLSIREYLRPLAIVSEQASAEWGVPTVNSALASLGVDIPVLAGSIRGFATSAQFKKQHPERFVALVNAMQRTLQRDELKHKLEAGDMDHRWLGPAQSTALMQQSFETFKAYAHLLKLEP